MWPRLYVLLASVCGLAYLITIPVYGAVDEVTHVARVGLIEQGWVIPATSPKPPEDYELEGCLAGNLRWNSLAGFDKDGHDWSAQFGDHRCTEPSSAMARQSLRADVYSPVPYAPALVGFRLGRAVHGAVGSVYGARLSQLAAFIALMWWAIRTVPWGKPLLFTIGLLPVVVETASTVSADPMSLALLSVFLAFVLRSVDQSRRNPVRAGRWLLLGCVAVAIALSKSAYAPFVLLLLAVPTGAFGSWRRRAVLVVAIVGVAATASAAWNFGVAADIQIGTTAGGSIAAARVIQDHPMGFLRAIGHGWAQYDERHGALQGLFYPASQVGHNPWFPLPLALAWLALARLVDPVPAWFARIVGRRRRFEPAAISTSDVDCVGGAPDESTSPDPAGVLRPVARWDRIWGALVAVTVGVSTFILIEYGIAIVANPVGADMILRVQGRYFIPLIPLTLFGVDGLQRDSVFNRLEFMLPLGIIALNGWWIWWNTMRVFRWF